MRSTLYPVLLLPLLMACGNIPEQAPIPPKPEERLIVAFYNLENLWDPADDPSSPGDDEFTPRGRMKWTSERYEKKLASLARAIQAMAGNEGPDILGVCELENASVLERLVEEFLPRGEYRIMHADSPDERGIDVALLYRARAVEKGVFRMHRIDLGPDSRPTRDILHATFTREGHTFSVLVNHWPSKRGGARQTSPLRERAAAAAARVVDSLTALDPDADIVLMGDFNDEPGSRAVHDVLDARRYMPGENFTYRLVNTAVPVAEADTIGSYFYQHDWETIDQIMLSPGLLDAKGLMIYDHAQTVFAPEFLRDPKADPVARPPHRTYIRGTLYIAGTSDHFPVYLRVAANHNHESARIFLGE